MTSSARRMAGASPPVPDDSSAAGLGGRGPVPLYLTIKDDYLVVRATRGGAAGAGARSALDPMLVLRAKGAGGRGGGVVCETMSYQDAIKQERLLGNEPEREIQGLLGVITLLSGPYLVVIDQSEVVGLAPNCSSPLRRISRTSLLPVSRRPQEVALQLPWQRVDEKRYLRMAEAQAGCGLLFFSPKYPLHLRMELALGTTTTGAAADGQQQQQQQEEACRRFLWNQHLLSNMSEGGGEEWCSPCISGYAASRSAEVQGQAVSLTLISRRSVHMQGTRFNRRGVNGEGEAANLVETELVLHRPDGARVSHVQLRGSLPLQWRQEADLSYTPPVTYPEILPTTHIASCSRHLSSLRRGYGGSVLLVNLIDSCGSSRASRDQAALGAHLAELVSGLDGYVPLDHDEGATGGGGMGARPPPPLSLTWFDFHRECSKMRWHRLSRLLARVDRLLAAQGRTVIDNKTQQQTTPAPASSSSPPTPQAVLVECQRGVVRTNCMDNLDRTNVVQSLFARRVLLHALGLLPPPQATNASSSNGGGSSSSSGDSSPPSCSGVLSSPFPGLESALKDLWACNADALSRLYAGTSALKTDFVRTGRRTLLGALQDGQHSVTRYYINNFWDGRRQDGVTLFLGLYRPALDLPSPFPHYCLPTLPGGAVFSLSYGLQCLPPLRLTQQLGVAMMEAGVWVAQALTGLADDSLLLWLGALYLLLLLNWLALAECVVCLGPFTTWQRLRRRGQAFTDRPMLQPSPPPPPTASSSSSPSS